MSPPPAPRPTYRSALRTRPFRRLLAGHGLGTIAQLMLTLAVGIEVLERTGSGWWVSVTVALGFVPYVLASGYAGLLADRHSRSTVLTLSFSTRAGCAAVLVAGLALHGPIALLVTVAAVAAVLATPSYPALAAATVQCVPDEQLPPANALVTGVENVTWMAGPGVLGLLLLIGAGPTVGTATAAGLFVLAAALSAAARLPAPARPDAAPGVLAELRAGLSAVARVAAVRRPMTVAVIDNFLYGYLVVAMVLLAAEVFAGDGGGDGADNRAIGLLNAALSVGGVLALLPINLLAARFRPARLLLVTMTGFGAVTVLLGLSGAIGAPVGLAMGLVAVAGAGSLIAEVTAVTLLQRAAPDELTARVFGVYDQLNVGALALGSLLAGPLAAAIGAGPAMVAVASTCLALAAVATGRLREPARRGRHAAAGPGRASLSPPVGSLGPTG
ncbi:MFS transporter [Nakamurella multipartita]|jgi:MFS family permease|uniref:Major facilitator superfamily MFS_1 n=1 Tax=Nakamurella multipartita (strain ATCC 700099 / DSM 44233 / CIP 104796 / JCM 9543 / NBRC 105858 / Y-104) TaxID=479431 RepID=C8XB23_NAKMY|nr:MFS transporter [Nakamurella multipartita]ACV81315.1 major facilitator superfamily MFS_1 [Nakamurella multipartita DSM 44233]